MKKKLFIFSSLLFFNICIFAHTGTTGNVSDTYHPSNETEQIEMKDSFADIEMRVELDNRANEETAMCTASLTKDGVKMEVSAPCSKIVEAAKALLRAANKN